MVEDLIKRLRRADLSAINKACEILDGLPQDAIDGGWTARGISAYAKKLEADLALQKQVTDAARQHQAELLERVDNAEDRIAGLEAARIAYASEFAPDAEGLPDVGSIHANIRALKSRITALQSERDALVNSVAAGGKEAVDVDVDLVLRCQELEELATRGESDQTALNRLADTYLLDISAHDRKAMARNQTHHEAMRFVISAAAAPTAALENGDGRDAWISVDDRLPKCSRAKGSLGVEVLVWPLPESGEATAFYGRRVTDTPAFYRYGAVINRITHWQPLPSPPAGLSQKAGE